MLSDMHLKSSFLALFLSGGLLLAEPSDQRIAMLYNSLDPTSISQHLAFYELYQPHPISQKALNDVITLLSGNQNSQSLLNSEISFSVHSLVELINKPNHQQIPLIQEENLREIERFSARLAHRQLKGHGALNEKDVLKLTPEEVDVARGLFLSQFGNDIQKIRTYEALIDLMALQVLARLPRQASPKQKILKINELVFEEMGFRFPPQSLQSKEIDVYTFLPSVLDSHRGVCLGVSILYLCIAQRLDLNLEMITPPGHIYVRYQDDNQTINVETTARGIHVESEEYLGVNTRSLKQRTIKEVIGLAHFNQASVFWQKKDYEKAYEAYQEAKKYMGNDPLLNELLGYICLFTHRVEEGEKLLHLVKNHVPDHAIIKNHVAEDYFNGHVDAEGIKTIFSHTDDNRQAVLTKKNELEQVVKKYPLFRAGLLHLALSWVELHRSGEALEVLKQYHQLFPDDPEANYYLSILYGQRMNYQKSWEHLRLAEALVAKRNHKPKALKELRRSLTAASPE
jgi:tetratricopeptide (TPR) repeat protein